MERPDTAPIEIARTADLMAGFPGPWALCGGWSVDAWLGRVTRDHGDVDLAIFEEDQHVLRHWLAPGWLLNGHDPDDDDSTSQWDGRRLQVPAHIHAYADGHNLDIQLNWRVGDHLLVSLEPRIALPISAAIRPSNWSGRTLAPEATLFFKAIGAMNPKDEADFRELAPTLRDAQRLWLRRSLHVVRPGHPWLPPLA